MTDLSTQSEQGARKVSARSAGVIVALALAGTGAFFIWRSWLLSFGDLGVPGPGLFPFILGIALLAVSLAVAAEEWRREDSAAKIELGHRNVIVVFVALVALSALFETAGAYAALGVMTALMLWTLARVTIVTSVLATAVGMVLVWIVFKVLLGVQLPVGPF